MYHIVCPAKYRRDISIEEIDSYLKEVCSSISNHYEIIFVEIGRWLAYVH